MPLYVQPSPGQLLMCNFETGFILPEMTKTRPVVVVSRRRRVSGVCAVVPLSTAVPDDPQPYHHQMNTDSLPGHLKNDEAWAKCDMITAVSLDRLDRIYLGRNTQGKRVYVFPNVILNDLVSIKEGVRFWLNL